MITNLTVSQQAVRTRTGSAANRNVDRDLLWTAMLTQRTYVQVLVNQSPERAIALIHNAGFVLGGYTPKYKALLSLTRGTQSGTVLCDANVGLLVAGMGAQKSSQNRFFGWEYTLDGSKTFVAAPSTPIGKTVLLGLPPLATVGVRVSLTNRSGQGAWSQVVSIIVH